MSVGGIFYYDSQELVKYDEVDQLLQAYQDAIYYRGIRGQAVITDDPFVMAMANRILLDEL